MGHGRLTRKQISAAIQQKIHPALPELLNAFCEAENAWKVALQRSELTQARLAEITEQLDEELERIRLRYSGSVQPPKGTFGVEAVYSEKTLSAGPEAVAIAEYDHWHRHRRALRNDIQKMEMKDWPASGRVQRTLHDYEILRCGQGPTKPFKGDTDHWDFFAVGWGPGAENLTPAELADFADSYCLCGSKRHDPDNLKQQRLRFDRARKNAVGNDAIASHEQTVRTASRDS